MRLFLRPRLLATAGAAALALGLALPATAASATPPKLCTVPVFFGLHGMAEGPSLNISTISPEIVSFDHYQNVISGAVLEQAVPYTTVYPNLWGEITTTYGALYNGEHNLQNAIQNYRQGCRTSQLRIALVGYSMGSWVINDWIESHPLEWSWIRAVVLYGDPCWVHNGNATGLARGFPNAGLGCMPKKDYPYPLPGENTAVPFLVQSWSFNKDPVTGEGWAGNRSGQIQAAMNCKPGSGCTHLAYTGSSAIQQGAQFVVNQLTK